ncbi:GNAT superfamily N-acetyltransferase [Spinactinospora alkalitolerans]|uniref:GNAT superfamily N-acetyltransferase n=1 Tax=Spinactinospora alkalitolerans TaxID=687207 RepID=A0A852TS95_9ACTN|nr:GNAT family N-acetyltransferase [Spinactinospora alkalitolerans]NYE45034.1 GNAT superfamily N-acetyltransferase [Spinactinospora alkalitolerans]
MIIRAAIRSDLGAILRLLRDLGDTAPAQSPTVRMSSAAVRAWTRIETDPDRSVLVAERRGQIIGTLDLIVVANLTHDAQPWAVIDNVVVDGLCRRRGVGRALMDDALDRASRAGCYKVELLSHENRHGAHDFYRSMGFENSAEGFRRFV